MEMFLIIAIVSLSMAIFVAGGFWYLRDQPERSSPRPVALRRRAESERWDQAVRASRNY